MRTRDASRPASRRMNVEKMKEASMSFRNTPPHICIMICDWKWTAC